MVRCLACGPARPGSDESPLATAVDTEPLGPPSELREAFRPPGSPTLDLTADAEPPTDRALREHLRGDARVLTDRRLPGVPANLDHLVIAPSGVWVVDSKYWVGRIEYRADSLSSANYRLIIGGADRTDEIDSIYSQVIPVAEIVGRDVPVEVALVLVLGDWSLASLPRLVFNRPFKHGSVWIAPLRILIKRINEPGPLGPADVERLTMLLDRHLSPAEG